MCGKKRESHKKKKEKKWSGIFEKKKNEIVEF
jgi:hypothetical protein